MNRRQFSMAISWLLALAAGRGRSNPFEDRPLKRLDRFGDPLPEHALARLGTIRFWDGSRFGGVKSMAFSPDGRWIATAGIDPPITIWDANTGQEVRRLGEPLRERINHSYIVHCLSFSADGSTLAVGRREGLIERWEMATGRELPKLEGHAEPVTGIAYSADGRTMATCDGNGTILIREADSGKVRHALLGGNAPRNPLLVGNNRRNWPDFLVGVALSSDGSVLVSCGNEGSIAVWNATTGQAIRTLATANFFDLYDRHCVAISPDGKTVAVGARTYNIGVWDVPTGHLRFLLEAKQDQQIDEGDVDDKFHAVIASLAFSPDGKTLASAGGDASVRLWDLAEGREQSRLDWRGDEAKSVAFGPGGRSLAAAGSGGTIQHWSLPDGVEKVRTSGHRSALRELAFTPDGKTLVSVGCDAVCRSNPETGEMLLREPWLPEICYRSKLSNDGRMLAFQGLLSDSTITVIETARGRVIRKFDGFGPDRGVISPSFSADGKTLILGFGEDDKPSIVFFDLATGRELRRFARAEHDHGDKLQLSADGRTLVNVNHSPRTIFVYDATTGRVRHQFELNEPHDHTDWTLFRSAALSPDGKLLITTDEADAIRTWDVFEGKQIRRFEAKVEQDSLGSIAFEPGGKVVAMSASGEREGSIIRLCELATGREISRLEGHQGSVSALAFSPDGKRLASGGSDTTVLTWDVSAWI